MTEGIAAPVTIDLCETNRRFDGSLKVVRVQVVSSLRTGSLIPRAFHRGKHTASPIAARPVGYFLASAKGSSTSPKPSFRSA